MKKYTKILLIFAILRAFISIVFVPLFGRFSPQAEIVVFTLCASAFFVISHKLRNVKDVGSTPKLFGHTVSTVTFSGLMLIGYPIVIFVYSLLPTVSFRFNQFSRLPYGIDGALLLQAMSFIVLLVASVALVKSEDFKLNRRTLLLGGCIFALFSSSFQNVLSDFLFGCFIVSYLIRYGSVIVAAAYIYLYKLISTFLDLWVYNIIGNTTVSFIASISEIFGTLSLFGAVLLLGIYLDVRFYEKKKKMPLFSTFTVPAIVLMALIGYFTLRYTRI